MFFSVTIKSTAITNALPSFGLIPSTYQGLKWIRYYQMLQFMLKEHKDEVGEYKDLGKTARQRHMSRKKITITQPLIICQFNYYIFLFHCFFLCLTTFSSLLIYLSIIVIDYCLHACTSTYKSSSIHPSIHPSIYTYIHAYIHT